MLARHSSLIRFARCLALGLLFAGITALAQQPPAPLPEAPKTATTEPGRDAAENKRQAREEFLQGVDLYRRLMYDAALESFQKAANLDPSLLNARLYLAGTYIASYNPEGGPLSKIDNVSLHANRKESLARAADEYKKVLDADPTNMYALKGLAAVAYASWRRDEAREYRIKAIAVDPSDPDNYYWAGWIDWLDVYDHNTQRGKILIQFSYPGGLPKSSEMCALFRGQGADKIEEGMQMIDKSLKLRPDHAGAQAAMGLLYRARADYECDQPAISSADLQVAKMWLDKAESAHKKTASPGTPRPAPSRRAAHGRPNPGCCSTIRVSLGVAMGMLVHQEKPVYPPLALELQIQGAVFLAATISETGEVDAVNVVTGHPLLAQAALEAVRKWRYKPYVLNGEPVEIESQAQVNFTTSQIAVPPLPAP